MSLVRLNPCEHCSAKLNTIDGTLPIEKLAEAAAEILLDCRKCMAHVPRGLRPKRVKR